MDKMIVDNPLLNSIADKMLLSESTLLKRTATFAALTLALMVYGLESLWRSVALRVGIL
jgi:hypothetical protein